MLVKTLPVGQLETNCYVVTNEATLECVIIDPGDESNTVLDYTETNHLRPVAIMLTHGHFDHTGAAEAVAEETGAKVYMHPADDRKNASSAHFPYTLPENGEYFSDGETVTAAGIDFYIMSTPGHTPGGVTLMVEDALFTGDTLFKGSCGRTDLPGGDIKALMASLKKICSIEGEYDVYPGHMDSSSLYREKNFNFYCRKAMAQ